MTGAGGGLTVRVRRVPGAPVVAVRVSLAGGARREGLLGQALVAGRMLAEGSRRRDWRRIADEAEGLGMMLTSYGGFESHGLALDALAADWEQALAWAAELTFEPTFPEDRCAWIARQAAAELESLGDQPEVRTAWGFFRQLYHPSRRALPLHGTSEGLLALTGADCAAFHLPALGRRLTVTAAGDLAEGAVTARIEALFADAASAAAPAAEPEGSAAVPPPPAGLPERRLEVRLEATGVGEEGADEDGGPPQAQLYLGHLTVPRRHPDYEALELAAAVLGSGAGLTGRIPERIREREGLAYSAHAQTVAGAGLDAGRLVAYVATSVETVEQAERGVREEIARLVEEGITDGELADARSYLLGREPFERETARQWADLLVEAEHYGLPLDDPGWRHGRLAGLDRAAVEAAVRRHVRPEELRVTVGIPEG
jgi:zinc protease